MMSVQLILAFSGLLLFESRLEFYGYESKVRVLFELFYYSMHEVGPSILLVAPCISATKVESITSSVVLLALWVLTVYCSRISFYIALFSDSLYVISTVVGSSIFLRNVIETVNIVSPTINLVVLDLFKFKK